MTEMILLFLAFLGLDPSKTEVPVMNNQSVVTQEAAYSGDFTDPTRPQFGGSIGH